MNIKKFSKRGFSFVEVIIATVIIAVLAAMFTLNISSQKQTAKKEAEKLHNFLLSLMREADRTHRGFTIIFNTNGIVYFWKGEDRSTSTGRKIYWTSTLSAADEQPIIQQGFSLACNVRTEYTYNTNNNAFDPPDRTFTVTRDSDNTSYKIVVSGGRLRYQAP